MTKRRCEECRNAATQGGNCTLYSTASAASAAGRKAIGTGPVGQATAEICEDYEEDDRTVDELLDEWQSPD
jgi:hypothetical protein